MRTPGDSGKVLLQNDCDSSFEFPFVEAYGISFKFRRTTADVRTTWSLLPTGRTPDNHGGRPLPPVAPDSDAARTQSTESPRSRTTATSDEGAMQRSKATSRSDPLGVGGAGAAASPPGQRPPGLLALFPDTVAFYKRDASVVWRCTPGRSRRDRRGEQLPVVPPETVPWRSVVENQSVVLVLFFDLSQQHSLRVRNTLVDLCATHDLPCVIISSAPDRDDMDEEARSDRRRDPLAVCLQGTGFCHAPLTAVLRTALCVTQVPSLVVLHKGRRVSGDHEELALEWGAPGDVVAAWRRGTSALSAGQRLRATLAFPMCVVL